MCGAKDMPRGDFRFREKVRARFHVSAPRRVIYMYTNLRAGSWILKILDRRQSPDLPIKGLTMDKKALREETERLIREAMERKALVVKQGNTRIEATCGKCGKANRVLAEKGATRVKFVCKECGQKQETL